ncbi:MAG: hypothetical protein ISP41_05420 [Alphaproteobacteria bacterium]|nr:hypothetical protein [Alphaproteobacteria bacterium]
MARIAAFAQTFNSSAVNLRSASVFLVFRETIDGKDMSLSLAKLNRWTRGARLLPAANDCPRIGYLAALDHPKQDGGPPERSLV